MPIWLRRVTFSMIEQHYQEEQEAIEKARGVEKLESASSPVARPNIKAPSYTTKSTKS